MSKWAVSGSKSRAREQQPNSAFGSTDTLACAVFEIIAWLGSFHLRPTNPQRQEYLSYSGTDTFVKMGGEWKEVASQSHNSEIALLVAQALLPMRFSRSSLGWEACTCGPQTRKGKSA